MATSHSCYHIYNNNNIIYYYNCTKTQAVLQYVLEDPSPGKYTYHPGWTGFKFKWSKLHRPTFTWQEISYTNYDPFLINITI